jgi:competence protein ComEC
MIGRPLARQRDQALPRFWFRPLLPLSVVFALGVGSRSIWPDWQFLVSVVAGVAFVLTGWAFITHRRSWLAPLLLFGSLGYISLHPWLPNSYPAHHINHHTDGARYRIVGTVDQLPRLTPNARLRAVIRVEEIGSEGYLQGACGYIRLTVFGDAPELRAGDRLAFTSRLRPIRNFRNPGGFDYRRHMALKKITATAWAQAESLRVVSPNASTPPIWYRARQAFRLLINAELAGEAQAVMKALTIGERHAISAELREVFNRLGIGHLLAISGLHVGIIAIVLMGGFQWIFHRFSFVLAIGGGRAAAICATLPAILIYGLMAGMAPSTQRAVIMVSLGLGAYLLRREGDTLNLIALAGLLILVWHPPMLFSIGFQMSFAAVWAIVLGLGYVWPGAYSAPLGWRRLGFRLLTFMAVTLFATAGTLPLLMYYFHQFSLFGLVANLVAVPLIGFVVLPLGLISFGLLPLSETLASLGLQMGGFLLNAVLKAAHWASAFDFVALSSFQPTGLEIGCYYALLASLGAMCVYPRAKWMLAAAVVFLVVDAGWWYHHRIGHSDLRLTVLDVGQGSAALVEFPGGQTMLVDGGGFANNRVFDIGRRVIAPFLRRQKILTVDYLILSHPSSDHMNGLFYVMQQFNPRMLIWNQDRIESASAKRFADLIKTNSLQVPSFDVLDRRMEIGGAIIQILNPPSDFDRRRKQERWRNLNNNSIALRLTFQGRAILLPGDIEAPAELEMLQRRASALKSTILLVPHHGSRTSSSAEFLAAVAPQIAIVSCGWRNRFGFPHPEVLARYRDAGTRVLRTDNNGAVQIRLHAGDLYYRCADGIVGLPERL